MVARRAAFPASVALLAAALGIACGHGRASQAGPATTLSDFAERVARGDADGAYRLLSASYRARVPLEAFRSVVASGGAGLRTRAQQLEGAAGAATVRAELDVGLGETVTLVWDGAAFRADKPTWDPFDQSTPRAALRAFVRAAERQRWDVMVRLAPARVRSTLTAQQVREAWQGPRAEANREMIGRLASCATWPIVELGDEAHMPYGSREEVTFVREDGLWRIEDPE